MKETRDILAERPELKKMPYTIPEGYFEEFRMQNRPCRRQSPWKKAGPYISIAASIAVLLTGGLILSRPNSPADDFTHEDFLVFSDSMTSTEYYEYAAEQYADAEMANDDIIDYLIYSGITVEEIEHYK